MEEVGKLQLVGTNLEARHNWIGSKLGEKIKNGLSKHIIKTYWQVRLTENEFSDWWQSKNKATIFFDVASKGNPGKAGARGLIFYPGRKIETSFSWGIGKTTNNQA